MIRVCLYLMLPVRGFPCEEPVLLPVIDLNAESVGDPEPKCFADIFYRHAVLVSVNTDVTVRTDDPLLEISDSVVGLWERKQ